MKVTVLLITASFIAAVYAKSSYLLVKIEGQPVESGSKDANNALKGFRHFNGAAAAQAAAFQAAAGQAAPTKAPKRKITRMFGTFYGGDYGGGGYMGYGTYGMKKTGDGRKSPGFSYYNFGGKTGAKEGKGNKGSGSGFSYYNYGGKTGPKDTGTTNSNAYYDTYGGGTNQQGQGQGRGQGVKGGHRGRFPVGK